MRSVISVYLDSEAIERRSDAGWKLGLQLSVAGAVREMGEPGLARSDSAGRGDRFRDAEMGRMLRAKERVDHENAHAAEFAQSFLRKLLGVGDVSEFTDSVAVNRNRSVRNGDRHHLDIANWKTLAGPDVVRAAFGLARSWKRLGGRVEDVGEPLRESLHRVRRTIHVDRRVAPVREGADVVNAIDVVGVVVREQNGVDSADARGNELQAQLRRGVDEDVRSTVSLDQRSYSGAFVPCVRRSAHIALASDLRDAETGSCPQEGELQTVSTLSRLVVPGMSKGTPAVTMMRSPLDANSLSATTLLVRCIISS